MNSEKIYQELNKRGYNASIIAEAINVLPQSVAVVIRTGKGSKRIATAISAAMDKKLEDVFPFYREKANKKAHRQQRATSLIRKTSGKNIGRDKAKTLVRLYFFTCRFE